MNQQNINLVRFSLIAVATIAIIFVLTFNSKNVLQPVNIPIKVPQNATGQDIKLVSLTIDETGNKHQTCSYNYCLFNDNNYPGVFGWASITGFSTTTKESKPYTDKPETISCDSFVITDGTEELLNYFRSSNAPKDVLGRPIIHLNLPALGSDIVQKIKKSEENKPVVLNVLQDPPVGKDGGDCYTSTNVLRVLGW